MTPSFPGVSPFYTEYFAHLLHGLIVGVEPGNTEPYNVGANVERLQLACSEMIGGNTSVIPIGVVSVSSDPQASALVGS